MVPTRDLVLKAMDRFKRWGEAKFYKQYSSGRRPKGHHLEYKGEHFPLKALWAAAHSPTIRTRDFQTAQAIQGFRTLRIGNPIYIYKNKPMSNADEEDELDADDAAQVEAGERRERLQNAPRFAIRKRAEVFVFERNPDVVAEVLYKSSGYCQECGEPAPFLRATDNTPYLEVHHKVPLAEGGEDTVENAIALCPNCHRRAHFG